DEADKQAASLVKELKEREVEVKRAYDAEQKPLRDALKSSRAADAEELLALFKERELVHKRREAAQARVDKIKQEPEISRLPVEIPLLTSEKEKLEEQVQTTGFTRPVGEIEA